MVLDSPVAQITQIGTQASRRLEKLEIRTVRNLIYHFPARYQNYSLTPPIFSLQPGETVTVKGQIISIQNVYLKTGRKLQKATLSDGESKIEVVWFNQPYLVKTFPVGTWVSLSGKVGQYGRKKTLVSPEYEKITSGDLDAGSTLHTGRLVPVYPETLGVSSKWLRSRVAQILPEALTNIREYLPGKIREKYNLCTLGHAIEQIHFPKNWDEVKKAQRRLAFDEFLEIQLKALVRRKEWEKQKVSHLLTTRHESKKDFINSLPFKLTAGQKKAIDEIVQDLGQIRPMNRLLLGDVGSGKTVIAAFACFVAFKNGFDSAVMAPTQILAEQHLTTLSKLLSPHGIKIELITAKSKPKNKAHLYVGTHAILHHNIDLSSLAVLIIDEQHRFGVKQRASLASKNKVAPHVLTMSATPIPRTVALTVWGDLSLSVLDKLPEGRLPIKTWVVPPQKRTAAYAWIKKQVDSGEKQAFIVCPLIDQSDKETLKSVRAASAEYERLKKEIFPDLHLGLLHGRIKQQEKTKLMQAMKEGKIDILVATPVVEVGIDIPNAIIMMVETAERFGLAQLHQLRGRVGRGSKQSYCLLFSEGQSPRSLQRLKSLERNLSGPELAELDLKLRGPGELYGTAQHGYPVLKVGSFQDTELIQNTQEAAQSLLKNEGFISTFPDFMPDIIAPN